MTININNSPKTYTVLLNNNVVAVVHPDNVDGMLSALGFENKFEYNEEKVTNRIIEVLNSVDHELQVSDSDTRKKYYMNIAYIGTPEDEFLTGIKIAK